MSLRLRSGMTRLAVAALVMVAGLVGGYLAGQLKTPVVYAICKGPNLPSCGGDTTRTSAVHVIHEDTAGASIVYVEPDTGETINITAYWNEGGLSGCNQRSETATVRVDWDAANAFFTITSSSLTANIVAVSLCDVGDLCTSGQGHEGWGYNLIVSITDPIFPGAQYNLRQVVYSTTAVDDGYDVNTGNCTLGSGVTADSQTFTITDGGPWQCAFNCNQAGPDLILTYH
jgi:hypothetical protein